MNPTFTGKHVDGMGQASQHLASYDADFNCRMVGTFNIRLRTPFDAVPCKETRERQYWLLTVSSGPCDVRMCWATRDRNSDQPEQIIELLSKAPLPDTFKTGPLQVTVWEPWSEATARAWAQGQYWFQSWPWTPTQKADSQFVWEQMQGSVDWSGARVLDIGGNAGFHAFQAAKMGAQVTVVEPSAETRTQGETIARHIEQQDVEFVASDPGVRSDVILYLSVHHQIDQTYTRLVETLEELGERADTVIVELHVDPQNGDKPVQPYYTEPEIDGMFTEKLVTYKSNVRGRRSVYVL